MWPWHVKMATLNLLRLSLLLVMMMDWIGLDLLSGTGVATNLGIVFWSFDFGHQLAKFPTSDGYWKDLSDLLYTEWKFMYLKGVSRCQVLDRNDTLSCLDKRWKWQILWPWETSEFGAIHSQLVWDWHKESHSLAWEMVTRRVPKPHKAPPLLFTSLQDSFHRNRGQSHLRQISKPFQSKRLPRTQGLLEISPQNKTLWDQTVPNFATLWWLWLFMAKFRKVGQTFSICSPLIQ